MRAVIGQHVLEALHGLAAQGAGDRHQVGRDHAAVGIGDAPGGAVKAQADQLGILAAEQQVGGLVGEGELAGRIGFDQGDRDGVEHVEHATFQRVDLALGLEQKILELTDLERFQRGDDAAGQSEKQQDRGGKAENKDQVPLIV